MIPTDLSHNRENFFSIIMYFFVMIMTETQRELLSFTESKCNLADDKSLSEGRDNQRAMKLPHQFKLRFFICFLCVLAACLSYVCRGNINIAIVSMAGQPHENVNHSVIIHSPVCPENEILLSASQVSFNSSAQSSDHDKTYDWSQSLQGFILGSFYYSYILFQMPAGIAAEKFGGRYVVSMSLFGSCIISLLTPVVTDWVALLIFVRFVMGATQAGLFPASFGILCRWMPKKERTTAFALLNVGRSIGLILPYFTSGPLISSYGWQSMFYIPGVITFFALIIFVVVVRSGPEEHSLISQYELQYIRTHSQEEDTDNDLDNNNISRNLQEDYKTQEERKVLPIPWMAICTNSSVLSVAFFQFSIFYILTILNAMLPKYLDEVLRIDISTNGMINGILNTISLFSVAITGYASEFVIQRKWLSRTSTRKAFSLVSGGLTGIFIGLIPAVGCNTSALQVIVFLTSFFSGFISGSDTPLPSEMSTNFPASLFALLNMIATSTGFIAPAVAGLILQSMQHSVWFAWSIIFYSSAGLLLLSTVIFLTFVSAERQSFDFSPEELKQHQSMNVNLSVMITSQ